MEIHRENLLLASGLLGRVVGPHLRCLWALHGARIRLVARDIACCRHGRTVPVGTHILGVGRGTVLIVTVRAHCDPERGRSGHEVTTRPPCAKGAK